MNFYISLSFRSGDNDSVFIWRFDLHAKMARLGFKHHQNWNRSSLSNQIRPKQFQIMHLILCRFHWRHRMDYPLVFFFHSKFLSCGDKCTKIFIYQSKILSVFVKNGRPYQDWLPLLRSTAKRGKEKSVFWHAQTLDNYKCIIGNFHWFLDCLFVRLVLP